jgi:hypothetical protein
MRIGNSTKDLATSDYKLELPNLCSLELRLGTAAMATLYWLARCTLPKLTTIVLVTEYDYMNGTTALSTLMQAHGSKLNSVRLDTDVPRITAAVFPHTPYLSRLQIDLPNCNSVEMARIHHWFEFNLDKLPHSVTEVVYSGFEYDAGFYKPLFEMMSDAARNARKKGSMLHSFRVVRTDEDESWCMENMPYSWENVVEALNNRRDWTTWGIVTRCVAKLLGVGIKVWDEYDVALSDVIERLGESDSSDSDSLEADVIDTDSLDSDSTGSDSNE